MAEYDRQKDSEMEEFRLVLVRLNWINVFVLVAIWIYPGLPRCTDCFFTPKIVRIVRICFQIVRIVRIFILENTPFFLNFHSFQQIFHEN